MTSNESRIILFENTPHHAPELVRAIYDAPVILLTFPRQGRPGKREGTRELVLSFLPYIVVYRIQDEVIQLVRILHGAQYWP
jgi:plasmid stabilization system protein ParE